MAPTWAGPGLFFDTPEVTKIVLRNFMCQIEPFGPRNLTKGIDPFYQRNIQYRARLKGLSVFSAL